jgi:HEAT repeat protein
MTDLNEGEAGKSLPGQDNGSTGDGRKSTDDESGPSPDTRLAHFIHLLSDDDDVSRWKAAEALGRMGDPAAVEDLISTLWDDDARVRLKAAWALGQIGDRRAYAPLQRLYRMENESALGNIRRAMSGQ